jgi:hypothetical protein
MVQVPGHIKHEDFKSRLFLRDERKFFFQPIPGDLYKVKWYVIRDIYLGGGGEGRWAHSNTLVNYGRTQKYTYTEGDIKIAPPAEIFT